MSLPLSPNSSDIHFRLYVPYFLGAKIDSDRRSVSGVLRPMYKSGLGLGPGSRAIRVKIDREGRSDTCKAHGFLSHQQQC